MAAPVAAVTPIMRLLVAMVALSGTPMSRFMMGTLKAPPPTPSNPLTLPATRLSANPSLRWDAP